MYSLLVTFASSWDRVRHIPASDLCLLTLGEWVIHLLGLSVTFPIHSLNTGVYTESIRDYNFEVGHADYCDMVNSVLFIVP